MKNYTLSPRLYALFMLIIVALVLLAAPLVIGSLVKTFSSLGQYTTFTFLLLIGILGMIFYTISILEKNLGVPRAIGGLLLGTISFGLFDFLYPGFNLPMNIIGIAFLSFFLFHRGVGISVRNRKHEVLRALVIGSVSAALLFTIIGSLLNFALPNVGQVSVYILSGLVLVMGSASIARFPGQDLVRFFFDLVVIGLVYGLVLWGARFLPTSIFSPFSGGTFFVNVFVGIILGVFVGFIGAFMVHRHHKIWQSQTLAGSERWYQITLFFGVLALSIFIGANPIIAAAVMGLLVHIKDAKDQPEKIFFPELSKLLLPILALLVGLQFSLFYFAMSIPQLLFIVLIVFIPVLFLSSVVLFLGTHMGDYSKARYISVLESMYDKKEVIPIIFSLSLFASSVVFSYNLLASVTVTLCLVVYIVFPYMAKMFKENVINN